MSFILASRVRETTTTTGTGSITLAGAVTGYQTFASGIGLNNQTYYTIADQSGNNWEVGSGTVTSGVLSRDTIYASSNSNALVNFTAGTKDVFCDYPAYSAVAQKDVGTNANQIPLNQYLGTMAWQDAKAVQIAGGTATLTSLASTSAKITNDATISGVTVGTGGGSTNTVLGNQTPSTTSASNNVYIGYQTAIFAGSSASNNVGIGFQALVSTTSNSNVAIGYQAGLNNTSGGVTAVGYLALKANTTGTSNLAFGANSLLTNQTGSNNTAIGSQAGYAITGSNNTLLGSNAGKTGTNDLTTGSNNLLLGFNTQASSATVSNEITIGNSSSKVIRYPHSYSTVANLPAATIGQGSRTFVTDALTPTFQATVTGGGAVFTPVYSDGTNWKVG